MCASEQAAGHTIHTQTGAEEQAIGGAGDAKSSSRRRWDGLRRVQGGATACARRIRAFQPAAALPAGALTMRGPRGCVDVCKDPAEEAVSAAVRLRVGYGCNVTNISPIPMRFGAQRPRTDPL